MTAHDPNWRERLSRWLHPSAPASQLQLHPDGSVSETVRSSSCIVDPWGTTRHVCARRDGRLLYHAGEECHASASLEIAFLTHAQKMVNDAFEEMQIDAYHLAQVRPEWDQPRWVQ